MRQNNKVNGYIVTKRGNRSTHLINKEMSRAHLGLEKVLLDQNAKREVNVIIKYENNFNTKVIKEYQNKKSKKLIGLVYRYSGSFHAKHFSRYIAIEVIQIKAYKLSDAGKAYLKKKGD